MSESISNEVLDILAKYTQLERSEVSLETDMKSAGVDSLVMVEIIFNLEEQFDISIPDPEFIGDQKNQFKTAADVLHVVEELIEAQHKSL